MSGIEDRVRVDQFSMYPWVAAIPLCDDLFLSMQAQNIALVDLMVLRDMETQLIREYWKNDGRMPNQFAMLVGATSQMWIYYLYEFLRTWRQRAQELIEAVEEYGRQETPEKKADTRARLDAALIKRRKHVRIAPNFYGRHMEQITDPAFVASVRAYREKTDLLFRRIEGVRVTLAKHEVPKTGKRQMFAEAPGYTRFDTIGTGSAYWQFVLKDDTVDVVQRRDVANEFLRITEDPDREEMAPTNAPLGEKQKGPLRKAKRPNTTKARRSRTSSRP
jgi:hypothetical protein